jgi:predicted metalloendopeptidase
MTGISALVASEPLETWKRYLRFRLIEHETGVLPQAFVAEHAAFSGEAAGDPTQSAIDATNAALGEAVGRLYVERYFPPQAKAEARAMTDNILFAYRARIANAGWMSAETKAKALSKLAALKIGLGYPDAWTDYASLRIVRGDAVGNLRRAERFKYASALARLKGPVDPTEWAIDPQTVGAVIIFSPNATDFASGVLQPPYFDPEGDRASNYGSAGAGIGHEISHSFDELGDQYDDQGRLVNWWTADDQARFHAAQAPLITQFGAYCPLTDLCVNGKTTVSENTADLAGLLAAHDAYVRSLNGKPDVIKGGLTGEQRFFVAFGQRWRKLQGEAALRQQILTDIHAPGVFRSDTVRNLEAWYAAFDIKPGDRLYLEPDKRVRVW